MDFKKKTAKYLKIRRNTLHNLIKIIKNQKVMIAIFLFLVIILATFLNMFVYFQKGKFFLIGPPGGDDMDISIQAQLILVSKNIDYNHYDGIPRSELANTRYPPGLHLLTAVLLSITKLDVITIRIIQEFIFLTILVLGFYMLVNYITKDSTMGLVASFMLILLRSGRNNNFFLTYPIFLGLILFIFCSYSFVKYLSDVKCSSDIKYGLLLVVFLASIASSHGRSAIFLVWILIVYVIILLIVNNKYFIKILSLAGIFLISALLTSVWWLKANRADYLIKAPLQNLQKIAANPGHLVILVMICILIILTLVFNKFFHSIIKKIKNKLISAKRDIFQREKIKQAGYILLLAASIIFSYLFSNNKNIFTKTFKIEAFLVPLVLLGLVVILNMNINTERKMFFPVCFFTIYVSLLNIFTFFPQAYKAGPIIDLAVVALGSIGLTVVLMKKSYRWIAFLLILLIVIFFVVASIQATAEYYKKRSSYHDIIISSEWVLNNLDLNDKIAADLTTSLIYSAYAGIDTLTSYREQITFYKSMEENRLLLLSDDMLSDNNFGIIKLMHGWNATYIILNTPQLISFVSGWQLSLIKTNDLFNLVLGKREALGKPINTVRLIEKKILSYENNMLLDKIYEGGNSKIFKLNELSISDSNSETDLMCDYNSSHIEMVSVSNNIIGKDNFFELKLSNLSIRNAVILTDLLDEYGDIVMTLNYSNLSTKKNGLISLPFIINKHEFGGFFHAQFKIIQPSDNETICYEKEFAFKEPDVKIVDIGWFGKVYDVDNKDSRFPMLITKEAVLNNPINTSVTCEIYGKTMVQIGVLSC